MSNIIGLNTKLFGLEKNIKQSEPTRVTNDLGQLGDPAEKERVLNPIVSESYMQKYIEEHGGGLSVYTCTLHCINNLNEPFDFADTIVSTPSAYAIDPETNYLMPAIDISAVVEPTESLDIVLFIQVLGGGFMACVFDGEYSSTMLYNAVNCSRIYDSDHDQTAIACEEGKNAEITFEVGGDS